jgi:ethanolamine-phosphate phospho-lyase
MEYFNSFGGNPVSCAVGNAVLNVIKEEGMQHNALEVGSYLLNELKSLQSKHSIIGDVRGMGLFIGIELIRDIKNLEPADAEAKMVINQMKDQKILLSTDGPDRNVIKIKPPMIFNRENANELILKLSDVLGNIDYE